jgi:hypothetical protein
VAEVEAAEEQRRVRVVDERSRTVVERGFEEFGVEPVGALCLE